MQPIFQVLILALSVLLVITINVFYGIFLVYMIKTEESKTRLLNVLFFLLAIAIQVYILHPGILHYSINDQTLLRLVQSSTS